MYVSRSGFIPVSRIEQTVSATPAIPRSFLAVLSSQRSLHGATCSCIGPPPQSCQRRELPTCSSFKGPEQPITQDSLSQWERSTEEDRVQLASLKEAFELADKDGNGVIDREELRELLQAGDSKLELVTLGWLKEAGVSSVMDSFDTDGSGDISFEEFASLARAGALLDGKFAEYREAFNQVDLSGNGTIGASEIQALFETLGQPLSSIKLWRIFEKYDRNETGQLEFPEFLELFRDELLDLREILSYLELHPRKGPPEKSERLVEAELGKVNMIFSEAELDSLLEQYSERLVVLEASLTWCRPCKGFEKTFQKLAEAFKETLFIKVYGNSNGSCKHLLEERLQVPLTPTFTFFRQGTAMAYVTGANKGRLYQGIQELLQPHENPLTGKTQFQQQVWRSQLGLG